MSGVPDRPNWERHPDDEGFDEVLFVPKICTTYDEADRTAFLRLGVKERYKMSGMSGDEWRFSTELSLRENPSWSWDVVSSGYHKLDTHGQVLYAELFGDFHGEKGVWTSHRWLFSTKVGAIAFGWKGLPLFSASYEGKATDLMVAAAHYAAARVTMDGHSRGGEMSAALEKLCCQPGCRSPLVSIYRKKQDHCRRCGHGKDPVFKGGHLRGFCASHLRRGDCGLDDADENYVVISGPGPDGHEPDPSVRRQSLNFGSIVVRAEEAGDGE